MRPRRGGHRGQLPVRCTHAVASHTRVSHPPPCSHCLPVSCRPDPAGASRALAVDELDNAPAEGHRAEDQIG
jgi:hypothetical protein